MHRDNVVQEMKRPETRKQIDRYLSRMLFWIKNGYRFTDEQRKLL